MTDQTERDALKDILRAAEKDWEERKLYRGGGPESIWAQFSEAVIAAGFRRGPSDGSGS